MVERPSIRSIRNPELTTTGCPAFQLTIFVMRPDIDTRFSFCLDSWQS